MMQKYTKKMKTASRVVLFIKIDRNFLIIARFV